MLLNFPMVSQNEYGLWKEEFDQWKGVYDLSKGKWSLERENTALEGSTFLPGNRACEGDWFIRREA